MKYTVTKLVKDVVYHSTRHGRIYLGDSLDVMAEELKPQSVDLIMTSPPFGLVRRRPTATWMRTSTSDGFAHSPSTSRASSRRMAAW